MGKGNVVSLIMNDHVIRYVLSSNNSKGPVFKAFGERYLPPGIMVEGSVLERETLLMILEECVSDWRIRRKPLLFTVPDNAVVVRRLEIDEEIQDEEVKGHLYLELGETLHLPFDEPIFDINIVGMKNGKKEVILIGSQEDTIYEYQELFNEIKLKPVVADLSSLAFYRLLYHLDLANPADHLLSLQLTIDSMNVTVFHKHVPVFTRHVKLVIENGTWEIKKDVEMDQHFFWQGESKDVEGQLLDAMAELERLLNYYRYSLTKGKEQITKLSITGDHPELLPFIKRCEETFNIKVHRLTDIEIVTKDGQAIPTRFNEVIGLSLKNGV